MTEDFTSYTKLDPNSRFTVTAPKVAVSGLTNDEAAYLYADKGAGHFIFPTGLEYGWYHEFILTIHGHAGTPTCVVWAVANKVANAKSWELDDEAIGLNLLRPVDPDQYAFSLVNYASGVVQGSSYANYTVGVPYRVCVFSTTAETFGRVTCQIHLPTGEIVDDFGLVVNRESYRYLFPVNSIDEADGDSWISFDVENLDLNETPPSDANQLSQPGRADARQVVSAVAPARFDTDAIRFHSTMPARADARGSIAARAPARFTTDAVRTHALSLARFDVRSAAAALDLARAAAHGVVGHGVPVRFDARVQLERLEPARFDLRSAAAALGPARFISHAVTARLQLGLHHAFVPPGWSLVACNSATGETLPLGFIDADASPKQLADAPIPDGVWEIEARPSEWFWDDTRGRQALTLVVGQGDESSHGLPVIQDLRSDLSAVPDTAQAGIVSFKTILRWRVVGEYGDGDFDFGLWFSATSPVDTSGAPDQTIPHFPGQGDYSLTHAQTASEHVAVAAFTDTDQGPVSELDLPWDADAPISPPNQLAHMDAQ